MSRNVSEYVMLLYGVAALLRWEVGGAEKFSVAISLQLYIGTYLAPEFYEGGYARKNFQAQCCRAVGNHRVEGVNSGGTDLRLPICGMGFEV